LGVVLGCLGGDSFCKPMSEPPFLSVVVRHMTYLTNLTSKIIPFGPSNSAWPGRTRGSGAFVSVAAHRRGAKHCDPQPEYAFPMLGPQRLVLDFLSCPNHSRLQAYKPNLDTARKSPTKKLSRSVKRGRLHRASRHLLYPSTLLPVASPQFQRKPEILFVRIAPCHVTSS
jgi:hypothetical protein